MFQIEAEQKTAEQLKTIDVITGENKTLRRDVERITKDSLEKETTLSEQLQRKKDEVVRLNLELDIADEVKKQRVRYLQFF